MPAPYPHFTTVHAEWLRARAAVAHCNTPEVNITDQMVTAAIETCRAAEWKLLQTPASDLKDIRSRAKAVLEMFASAIADGEPTDNRHRLMLAALVSEILEYSPRREASTAE